jgi:hypothetical protein
VQTDQGFEVVTPAGKALTFPKKVRTSDEAGISFTYPGGAAQELAGVGGWLGLLIFDLAVFSPLLFLVMVYLLGSGINVISYFPLLGWLLVLDRVSGMAVASASFYAGVMLYRVRPGAVGFTKRLLIISGVCKTAVSGLVYLAATNTGVPAIAANARTIPKFIVAAWVGCVVWYLYLSYSKRVAATYRSEIGRTASSKSVENR